MNHSNNQAYHWFWALHNLWYACSVIKKYEQEKMITYEQLSGLYYLLKIIERSEEQIKILLSAPHELSVFNKQRLHLYYDQLIIDKSKQNEIQSFLNSISDNYLKNIFIERFVKLKSWRSIAFKQGVTEDCVKKMCLRYFNNYSKEQIDKIGEQHNGK